MCQCGQLAACAGIRLNKIIAGIDMAGVVLLDNPTTHRTGSLLNTTLGMAASAYRGPACDFMSGYSAFFRAAFGTLFCSSTSGGYPFMARCRNGPGTKNLAAFCTYCLTDALRSTGGLFCNICFFGWMGTSCCHSRRDCGEHQENEHRQDDEFLFHWVISPPFC